MRKILIIILSNCLYILSAQTFTLQSNTGLADLQWSYAAWGDYDNDDDLDVLLTGTTNGLNSGVVAYLYKNNGNGSFSLQLGTPFAKVYKGMTTWADINNDGYLDVLICGQDSADMPLTRLYTNNAGNSFSLVNSSIIDVKEGYAAFGDYDQDGFQDLLIAGNTNTSPTMRLYKNIGGNSFAYQFGMELPSYTYPTLKWIDYNKDGWLDFIVSGASGGGLNHTTQIFINQSGISFSKKGLISVVNSGRYGSMDLGDIDNDGDIDFIITSRGFNTTSADVKIIDNLNDSLAFRTSNNITKVWGGKVHFGDYDNDGDLDVLISGKAKSSISVWAGIYDNDGTGHFTPNKNTGIDTVYYNHCDFVDVNQDGKLDVFISGNESMASSKLFINGTSTSNTAPSIPSNFTVQKSGGEFHLSWNASSDAQLPDSLLCYDVRVGSTTSQADLRSVPANLNSGFRRLHQAGLVRKNSISFKPFMGVNSCQTLYFAVQAVDQNGLASGFSNMVMDTNMLRIVLSLDTIIQLHDTAQLSVQVNNCTSTTVTWSPSASLSDPTIHHPLAFPLSSMLYKVSVTEGNQQVVDSTMVYVADMLQDSGFAIEPMDEGESKWVDLDADGDLDIVHAGSNQNTWFVKLYKNNNGGFVEDTTNTFIFMEYPVINIADINHDGLMDIFIKSKSFSNLQKTICYYQNQGNFQFQFKDSIYTNNAFESFTDYNGDGIIDFIVFQNTSYINSQAKIYLYQLHSSGNSVFLSDTIYLFNDFNTINDIVWIDRYSSPNINILIYGYKTHSLGLYHYRIINGTELQYVKTIGTYFQPYNWDAVDYDSDGDLDVLLMAYSNNDPHQFYVLKNDGFGNLNLEKLNNAKGNIASADYDNDGDIDIYLNGSLDNFTKSIVLLNNNLSFIEHKGLVFPRQSKGRGYWGDSNNDSKLDLLTSGYEYYGSPAANLFTNIGIYTNTPPAAPANLSFHPSSSTLAWSAPMDDHTPSAALTYDWLAFSATTGEKHITPLASVATGYRYVTDAGILGTKNTQRIILPYDSSYYVRVQAIDAAFAGSTFSDSLLVMLPPVAQLPMDIRLACGDSIMLNAQILNGDTAGLSYLWYPSTGLSHTNRINPIAKPAQSTWYKLKVSSPLGNEYIDSVFVEVGLFIDMADLHLTCGDTAQFNPHVISLGTPQFSWNTSYGLSDSTLLNPTVFPGYTSTYTLSVSDSLCSNSATAVVYVSTPDYHLEFSSTQQVFTSLPATVSFNNTTYNPTRFDFIWDFGDGTVLNDNNAIVTHTYSDTATFDVRLIAISKLNGCSDSLTKKAYIDCMAVGFKEVNKSDLFPVQIIPNPNKGEFIVRLPKDMGSGSRSRIELYSLMGKMMYAEDIPISQLIQGKRLSFPSLPKGMYLLVLNTDKGRVTKRIVVE